MAILSAGLTLHWFGTLVALGLLTGRLLVARAARVYGPGDSEQTVNGYTFLVIGGIVGAHLLQVLAYEPGRLRTEGLPLLFRVWDGSASAGGALGGFAATFLYYRSQGLRTGRYLDALTLGVAPGWAIARLGCAVAQDHPGIRSTSWMAVQFVDGKRLDLGLLDAVVLFVLSALLWWLARKKRPEMALLGVFALGYSVCRFFLDFLRATDLPSADRRLLGLTPAQWICPVMAGVGLWLLRHGLRGSPLPEVSPESAARPGMLPPAS